MLVSEDLVFLHMPKTGGGTVEAALVEHLPPGYARGVPSASPHPGWAEIPPEAAGLPVLTFVRNPWDWYVSWYHFSRRGGPTHRRLWRSAFGDDPSFSTFVRRACACELDHDDPALLELMGRYDFYTARFLALAGDGLDDERLTVGRFEHLGEDLLAFLRHAGAPVPPDFGERFAAQPIVHRGERADYHELYDHELRDLVGAACSLFTERWDYRF